MGIKGLAKLLSDEAPECIKEVPLSSLHGRKIAIDASMAIYQFLIAVRSGGPNNAAAMLTNADGETTSHIQGLFNRTIRFLTEGIRPVYVFDGKPPSFKSGELLKRREKREKAELALKSAKEEGNVEEEEKQSKRLVRAGTKENEDCIKLLTLMGVPVVRAPCEAEAQAAALARAGTVYACGTEDMDALTFRTPILLRKMTFANAAKSDIQTMDYKKAIRGLELTHDQFVDLCILLGCDYCDSIKGIGPKTALKLIREHKNIETILENLDRKKYGVPDSYIPKEVYEAKKKAKEVKKEEEGYNTDEEKEKEAESQVSKETDEKTKKEEEEATDENTKKEEEEEEEEVDFTPVFVHARRLFNEHEVLENVELKWKDCQAEELTKFLVDQMGFSEDRVKSNIEKLQKAMKKNSKPQMRMDSFFKVKENPNSAKIAAKRKAAKEAEGAKKKKGKKGGGFYGKKR
uniref:Flap endonuclease 1 n=1 Tax=Ditylum brightwellii TaxID=49249 RepID=A0A7S2EGZ9_9STRA